MTGSANAVVVANAPAAPAVTLNHRLQAVAIAHNQVSTTVAALASDLSVPNSGAPQWLMNAIQATMAATETRMETTIKAMEATIKTMEATIKTSHAQTQASLATMQTSMAAMQTSISTMETGMADNRNELRLHNAWSVARAFNPRAEDSMHNLEGLVTAAPQATAGQPQPLLGPVPPNFPATVGAFRELQNNVVSRLLNAYHLDTSGNIAAKRRRMAHHIGVIP